jgi:hypothetical protein
MATAAGLGYGFSYSYYQPSLAFGFTSFYVNKAISPPAQGFPVSINGRGYMVDTNFEPYRREAFRHKSIPPQRQSLHFTNAADDGTISTDGLWRREARDWSLGSGQIYFDRVNSDNRLPIGSIPSRFAHSKGVNPWTQWQLTLLQDTKQRLGSAANNYQAVHAANYVYVINGTSVNFYSAWPSSTSDTGTTLTGFDGVPLDIESNGYQIYLLTTTDLYVSNIGTTTVLKVAELNLARMDSSRPVTGIVKYVGGRLLMALSNIASWNGSSAAGASLFDMSYRPNPTSLITSSAIPAGFSGTTTNPNTNPNTTTLSMSSVTGLPTTYPYYLSVDDGTSGNFEVMRVNGASGTNLTVARGQCGTTGVSHSGNAPVNLLASPALNATNAGKWNAWYAANSTVPTKIVEIDNELFTVINNSNFTGIDTYAGANRLIMIRGVNGTTTATHASGSTVYVYGGGELDFVAPEFLFTHPNPNWVWSGITASASQAYFSGYCYQSATSNVVNYGAIFRSTIPSNTTSALGQLTYPVVALPLPVDEYPTTIEGYLNYIFIGTNKGIRMAQTLSAYDATGNAGDLKSGPLAPNITEIPSLPVTGIIGNDRYVYWTWNNYDGTSTGLGRFDLTSFIDTLSPSYASDLMITGQGTITNLSWDPFTNSPMMTIARTDAAAGSSPYQVWTADLANCVKSGTVDSGLITYGIADFKNAVRVDLNVDNQNGNKSSNNSSVSFAIDVDQNPILPLGSYNGDSRKSSIEIGQQFGEQFRMHTTLKAAYNGKNYISPTLNRWTLKALPGIPSGIQIMCVILLYEPVEMDGQTVYYDPYQEYGFLEALRQSQQIVPYVEGPFTADVTVDGIDWMPERRRPVTMGGYHGDLVVTLKTVSG